MYYCQFQIKKQHQLPKTVQHQKALSLEGIKMQKDVETKPHKECPMPAKQWQKTEELIKASAEESAEHSDEDFRCERTLKRCLVTSYERKVKPSFSFSYKDPVSSQELTDEELMSVFLKLQKLYSKHKSQLESSQNFFTFFMCIPCATVSPGVSCCDASVSSRLCCFGWISPASMKAKLFWSLDDVFPLHISCKPNTHSCILIYSPVNNVIYKKKFGTFRYKIAAPEHNI